MNTTESNIEETVDNKSEKSGNQQSKPECKNGVCELNWQPQRPQAA